MAWGIRYHSWKSNANATILSQLGIDHTRLTHKFQGRRFRLTDAHGHVVKELLA